jgi:hypothetical protein
LLALGLTLCVTAAAAAQTPPSAPDQEQPAPAQPEQTPPQPTPEQPTPEQPAPEQQPAPEPPAPEPQPEPEEPARQPAPEPPAPRPSEPEREEPARMMPAQRDVPTGGGLPRFLVSANGGYQFLSQEMDTSTEFDAFEEPATLTSSGELKSEPIFDFGVAYRLNDTYGFGAAFSLYNTESDVAVVARIPHPVFFDQVRIANYTAAGVKHTSGAIHLQGVWFVPFTTSIDFVVSAGPSIVLVKQDVVTAANLLPEEPPFSSPQIDTVTVTEQKKTAFGFNAGVDAIYAFTPRYGLGVNIRYVFAKADVDGLSDSLNVGGFQTVGGLRLRF